MPWVGLRKHFLVFFVCIPELVPVQPVDALLFLDTPLA